MFGIRSSEDTSRVDVAGATSDRTIVSAKASIATVDTLFHNAFFEIPTYQREFSWQDQQVGALINDLIEAFDARVPSEPTPQYFLGPIVTQERQLNEEGVVDVADKIVDGQQRFTSLMLIWAVLCKHLSQSLEKLQAKRARLEARGSQSKQLPALIEEIDQLELGLARALNLIFRPEDDHFVLDVEGYNYYLRKLMGKSSGLPPLRQGAPNIQTAALQKFEGAFKKFESAILLQIARAQADDASIGSVGRKALLEFADWLGAYVFVALIADTDPYDDQRLFDRMNSRGLPLSEGDKFKSRILASLGRSAGKAGRDWQHSQRMALTVLNEAGQSGTLALSDPREAEKRLLAGWFIATQMDVSDKDPLNLKQIRAVRLDPYDFGLKTFSTNETGAIDPGFYRLLKSGFFPFVKACRGAYRPVYSFDPKRPGFQHAEIMKLPYLDAMIAAAVNPRPRRDKDKRLAALSTYLDIIAFHRAWHRDNMSRDRLDKLALKAIEILTTQPPASLPQAFSQALHPLRQVTAETAPGLIPANSRWVRYFLGRLAYELEGKVKGRKPKLDFLNGQGPDTPEIEHIFSRRYNDDGSAFEFNLSEIESYRQRLGALTLLSRTENRKASNKSWEERLEVYKKSNVLTRTLVQASYDNHLRLKDQREDLSVFQFQPWDKITPRAIVEREKSYAALAAQIWSKERFLAL